MSLYCRAMFTPLEAFLGWRYTRAKRRSHFVSFISAIAMLGVALGIAALITILSIMNGFEKELRGRLLGMAAHVVVSGERGKLQDWQGIAARIASQENITGRAPFIRREAMLSHYDNVQGVAVRGVDPDLEGEVSVVAEKFIDGSLANLVAGEFSIVLGAGLAQTMQARVGSVLTVVAPEPVRTPAGMVPRLRRFTVVGVFEAGVHEFDTNMVLLHLNDAQRLFRYGNKVTGVRLRLDDAFTAPQVARHLRTQFAAEPHALDISDWTESNANLFKALKTEKIVMSIILALTIAVAAFNLVSTLVMVVAEKHTEIAILQTFGFTKRRVLITFFIHGGMIGAIGIVIGATLGVALAANVDVVVASFEQLLGVNILDPNIYYISAIPTELRWRDVVMAVAVAIGMCLIAPLYPAYAASQTSPAQALRYD